MRVAQFGADFHPNFLIPISGHWFLEVDSLYSIDTPCTIAYDATSSISERLGQVSRYKENPGILVRPHEIPAAAEADRQGAPPLDVQRPPIRVFGGVTCPWSGANAPRNGLRHPSLSAIRLCSSTPRRHPRFSWRPPPRSSPRFRPPRSPSWRLRLA